MQSSHRPDGELEVFVNSPNDLHMQCGRTGRAGAGGASEGGRTRDKHQQGDEGSLCKVLGFLLYLARAIEIYQAGRDTINCSF